MQIAYDEALLGIQNNDGGPFGAVIVQENRLIAASHNKVLKTNDPTAHAEVNVIRKASRILGQFDLSDCTLYTTGYPCPMCLGAILWARIPTVYYGATMEDAQLGGFDDKRLSALLRNPDTALDLRPLDVEKNRELFTRWIEKSDRQLY